MPARQQLRIGENLVQLVDRPARHADCLQRGEPIVLRAFRDRRATMGTSVARFRTRFSLRAKRSSRAHSGVARDLAEFHELAVVADRDDQVAVGAREHLVRHDVLMRIAGAAGRLCRIRGDSSP